MPGESDKNILEEDLSVDVLDLTRAELEWRVEERTAELSKANRRLQKEIVDRMRIEDRLRVSEERFRTQYKNIPVPTYTWRKIDETFVLVDYNDASHEITNGKIANYVGATADSMFPDAPNILEDLTRCFEQKTAFEREMPYHMVSTNKNTYLRVNYTYVRPDVVMVHTEDITERKLTDERISKLNNCFLSLGTDPRENMRKIVDAAGEILGGACLLYNRLDGKLLCTWAIWNEPEGFEPEDNPHGHICYDVIEECEEGPVIFENLEGTRYEESDPNIRKYNLKSYMGFPVRLQEKTVGSFCLCDVIKRSFTDGEIKMMAMLARAVSVEEERQQGEEDLRRGEERYRTIFETTGTASAIVEEDGTFVLVNAEFEKLSGYSKEEILGKMKWHEFAAEENRARLREFSRRDSLAPPQIHTYDLRFVNRGGRILHVHLTVNKIPGSNRTIASLQDITDLRKAVDALKESERKFREMAELLPETVFEMNRDGILTFVNQRAFELFGYSPEEFEAGLSCFDLFVPEDLERLRANIARRYRGEDLGGTEYTVRAKDNRKFPVIIYSSPIIRGSEVFGLRGLIIDITERKRAEMERQQLAVHLLEVQEEERKKISSVLHDQLGQLLFLAKLDLGALKPEDGEIRKVIETTAKRIGNALTSVRNIAISLRPPLLDNLGLEPALETLAEEAAESSHIEISFKRRGAMPPLPSSIETCLYRVLQEALTNVAKHAKATRADVLLEAGENELCLMVKDNGRGMGDPSSFSPKSIGLLGMRERLFRCNGSLEIDSKEGQGTLLKARIALSESGPHPKGNTP